MIGTWPVDSGLLKEFLSFCAQTLPSGTGILLMFGATCFLLRIRLGVLSGTIRTVGFPYLDVSPCCRRMKVPERIRPNPVDDRRRNTEAFAKWYDCSAQSANVLRMAFDRKGVRYAYDLEDRQKDP